MMLQESCQWVRACLNDAREKGQGHAMVALADERVIAEVADAVSELGWRVVTVWTSGNYTMVLMRWLP